MNRRKLQGALASILICAAIGLQGTAYADTGDWLQFDGNAQHSGNDTQEVTLGAGNVHALTRLFHVLLPSVADGAPAYLSDVLTNAGLKDRLFLMTRDGHVLALDAQTGATVWGHQYGPGSCRVNNGSSPCYTTSSPAIDPGRGYVYSYGLDGYVHKYRAADGVEVTTGGWPEIATTKPYNEKGSSDLSIATDARGDSYLYVTNGGYPGDRGDYQGHVTAIDLATGVQRVFNAACSNQAVHFVETPGTPDCPSVQSAIWARAGVVYDPETGKIYMATGNGDFDPAHDYWGDTVFALNPDGSGAGGAPLDTYTPTDYQQLQDDDADLGSTAPAVLPVPAQSSVRHLAVQAGKDARLRLINLDNLSGHGAPGFTGGEIGAPIDVPQGGEVLTAPAVWVNPADQTTWVFAGNGNGLSGLQLEVNGSGVPYLQPRWQQSGQSTSPIIAGNVLFAAGSNDLRALDPATGHQLWQDGSIGGIHWESPVVANGILYITDESGYLSAYALPTQTATVTVQQGWNLISLPLTSFGPVAASAVASSILGSSGGLVALYGLSGTQWAPYWIERGSTGSGTNFALQPGAGYLIYSDRLATYTERGFAAEGATAWTLHVGWNLVAGPPSAVQASTALSAILHSSGGSLAAVYGLSGTQWTPYRIDRHGVQSGTDFPLLPGTGYLVYTDRATSVQPGA